MQNCKFFDVKIQNLSQDYRISKNLFYLLCYLPKHQHSRGLIHNVKTVFFFIRQCNKQKNIAPILTDCTICSFIFDISFINYEKILTLRMNIDIINAYSFDYTDAMLTERALNYINLAKPDFVFLYMVETDEKGGHDRIHGTDMPEDMTIPMFFCGKQFECNKELENVSILDIAPTIADILGIETPREWEGKSLVNC